MASLSSGARPRLRRTVQGPTIGLWCPHNHHVGTFAVALLDGPTGPRLFLGPTYRPRDGGLGWYHAPGAGLGRLVQSCTERTIAISCRRCGWCRVIPEPALRRELERRGWPQELHLH